MALHLLNNVDDVESFITFKTSLKFKPKDKVINRIPGMRFCMFTRLSFQNAR